MRSRLWGMKKIAATFFLVFVLGIFVIGIHTILQHLPVAKPTPRRTIKSAMHISSPAFENNGDIPSKYTCDGENINPPLVFADVPSDAKSLVLIVDDPDAPMGTWIHWVVFNIPSQTREIAEHSVPQGVQSLTSFGEMGYGGPCPPSGTHHYHFKLYALDKTLSLDSSAKKADVEAAMDSSILAKSELVGLYKRQ